jgi:hypothetical protein
MSIIALTWVFQHSEATLGGRLVLLALAEHAHDDGTETYPAVDTLVARTRMSRKGVQQALRRLEADGRIERDGYGPRGQTKYRLIMDVEAESRRGGEPTSPREAEGPEGRTAAPDGGEPRSPEPSIEPSGTTEKADGAPARAVEQRAATDPFEAVPDGFPEELVGNLQVLTARLRDVARRKGSLEVTVPAVARLLEARPRKPHVHAVEAFEHYWLDGRGARKPVKDAVATFRNWIDREPDLAAPERIGANGYPIELNGQPSLALVPGNGQPPGAVRPLSAREKAKEEDRAIVEEMRRRAGVTA